MKPKSLYKIKTLFLGRLIIYLFALLLSLPAAGVEFKHITVKDGLSNRRVYAVASDSCGFMWFATRTGIDRYDGSEFVSYDLSDQQAGQFGIYTNSYGMTVDRNGTLWAISPNGKLYAYCYQAGKFIFKANVSFEEKITVWDSFLYCDNDNNIWIVSLANVVKYDTAADKVQVVDLPYRGSRFNGVMEIGGRLMVYSNNGITPIHYDSASGKYIPEQDEISEVTRGMKIKKLFYDQSNNTLWIGTFTNGLMVLQLKDMKFLPVNPVTDKKIRDIVLTDDNTVMIGVDGAGIYVLDRYGFNVKAHYSSNEDDATSLSANGVYDLYVDKDKRVWVSSYTGGVDMYDPARPKFSYLTHSRNNPNSVLNNEINYIAQDRDGDLWFATGNGLSLYNKERDQWRHFLQNSDPTQSSIVKVCTEDHDGNMWVGTFFKGLYVINKRSGAVTAVGSFYDDSGNIGSVYDMKLDKDGDLWVAPLSRPLSRVNVRTHKITEYPGVEQIKNLTIKSDNELYIGSNSGLYVFNKKTEQFTKIELSLSANIKVNYIYPVDNDIWVGTDYFGLIKYNIDTKESTVYNKKNGLPSNFISSIVRDNYGRLWVATELGLAYINLESGAVVNYTYPEFLSNYEFNIIASARLRGGLLAFGTSGGALIFDPRNVSFPVIGSNLTFTDLVINDKSIFADENLGILKLPLDQTGVLKLKYNQNVLVFKFISIDYSPFNQILYSWKLEGLDDDWTTPSRTNTAGYVKIPSGRYSFKVRTINPNDNSVLQERQIEIVIRRALWNSAVAWVLYLLLISGLVWLLYRYFAARAEKRNSQEKINFFINTAHDLKTPLTLIKAPLLDISEDKSLSPSNRKYLNLAMSNINKLQNFVTKLLDFERNGSSPTRLTVRETTLSELVSLKVAEFELNANHREIALISQVKNDTAIWIDRDIMDSILDNIITNALKYTREGGVIELTADCSAAEWWIDVKDSGIGIPRSGQARVFSRFYRAENSTNSQVAGTGIGLMLVKSLVAKHGGTVGFTSVEGVGTTFTVKFPISKDNFNSDLTDVILPVDDGHRNALDIVQSIKITGKSKIVIAEDNPELREYLTEALGESYNVYSAEDGLAAHTLVLQHNPDIVITDMMMPGINGGELCRMIKSDILTSHIPVIILTVLAERGDMVEGYNYGADGYITKPFDITMLKMRIENMLKTRILFQNYVSKMIQMPKNEDALGELDNQFIHKVINAIHKNIADPELSVATLSTIMNMSRSGFFNKIKALTGETPVDFIKVIRMKQAAELIKGGKYNINEISEMVGFADSKYFSTAFKKFYGKSPSKFCE